MSKKNKDYFNKAEDIKKEDNNSEELKVDKDSEIIINNEEKDFKEDDKILKIGTVNAKKLNVRELPSLSSKILKVLSMNDTVKVINDKDPAFYEIELEDSKGYVMKDFINL